MKIRIENKSLECIKFINGFIDSLDNKTVNSVVSTVNSSVDNHEHKLKHWYNCFRSNVVDNIDINIKSGKIKKQTVGFTEKLKPWAGIENNDEFYRWYIQNQTKFSILDKINITRSDGHNFLTKLMYSNPFIPFNCIQYLENNELMYREINQDGIHLIIYEKIPIVDVKKMFGICKAVRDISKKKRNIRIIAGFTPYKKKYIPIERNPQMHPVHINSGSSYKTRYINMWRYEEWEKVLIHELIHFLDLDFTNRDFGSSKVVKTVKQLFNIDGVCNPFEGYTELCGCILHCLYCCSRLNSFDIFKTFLIYETFFSIYQCCKIMNIIGSTSYKDIAIKQSTSVASYFFVKTSLLLNLNESLDFIRDDLNFGHTETKRFKLFSQLIQNSFDKLQILDNTIKHIKTDDSNLRMTCIQIN